MRQAIRRLVRREPIKDDASSVQHEAAPLATTAPSAAARTSASAPTPPPPPEADPITVSEDLWRRAYEALSEREADLRGPLSDPVAVRAHATALWERRAEAQLKFSIRSRNYKISDQLEKLVKLLALADGVVKQALSSQPYAALAWSTVSVFIPVSPVPGFALLSGGFANHAAMVQGFTTMGELQQYWRNYEDICLLSTSSEQYKQLAKPLSNIYSYILEYQVRAIRHASSKQLSRAWQVVAGEYNWKEKEGSIINMSDRVLDNIAPLQQQQIVQSLGAQNLALQKLCNIEEQILHKMDEQKQQDEVSEFLKDLRKAAGDYVGGKNINHDPVKGTCEWFFADESFVRWRDNAGSGVFWLTAGPGCGKSVLAKALIKADHLTQPLTTVDFNAATYATKSAIVCYFFFKEGDEKRTTSEAALCAVLHQLLSRDMSPSLLSQAPDTYRKNGDALMDSFHDLWDMLVGCAEEMEGRDLICVIDALDECATAARNRLIRTLDEFYKDSDSSARGNLKFFITSRPYDNIERSFRPLITRTKYFHFDADERHEEISHDINLVIDAHLVHFSSEFDEADCQKIAKSLKEKGTKTYLWLALTLDIIKDNPSLYSRRTDVETLIRDIPDQVSDAYERILSRSSNMTWTSALLGILLAATRPLTLDETNHALAYALADPDDEDEPEPWKGDFKATVKNICGLIVNVYDGALFFIHLTAREFLLSEPKTRRGCNWQGRFADASVPHTYMSKSCIHYLLRNIGYNYKDLDEYDDEDERFPMLMYASLNWALHFRASSDEAMRASLANARELCNHNSPTATAWVYRFFKRLGIHKLYVEDNPWPPLSLAVYADLPVVARDIIDSGVAEINKNGHLGTALHAAADIQSEVMCLLLLQNGARVDVIAKLRGTPLAIAAKKRHNLGLTQLLLAHGASPLRRFSLRYTSTTSTVQMIAAEEHRELFVAMAASLADISSPNAVLAAFRQGPFQQMDTCQAMLLNLLPDHILGDKAVLDRRVTRLLLMLKGVGERAVPLIFRIKNPKTIFHKSISPLLLSRSSGCEHIQRFVAENESCRSLISLRLLLEAARLGDAATLTALAKYCPPGVYDGMEVLKAAIRNKNHGHCIPAAVAFDEGLFADSNALQTELLDRGKPDAILAAFDKIPRYTATVARRLVMMILQTRNGGHRPVVDMMKSILDRSPFGLVVDYELLMQAAEDGTAPLMTLLLAYAPWEEIKAEALLAAALRRNYWNGLAVMEALLAVLGSEAVAAPSVLIWANGKVVELLLARYGARISPIPRLIISMLYIDAFEALFTYRPKVTTQAAMAGFRMYAYQVLNVGDGSMRMAKYLLGTSMPLTEDTLLDMLEPISCRSDSEQFLQVLLEKRGDEIVLTERVLAAMIESGRDAIALVKQWRPDELIITPAIIAMTAASGRPDTLYYLRDACRASGGSILDDEDEYSMWHWIACFRRCIRYATQSASEIPNEAQSSLQNTYGLAALHMAVYTSPEVLRHVLAHRCDGDMERLDRRGWTALHHAAVDGEPEKVKMLVDAGAETGLKGTTGEIPADLARWTAEFAMWPGRDDWRDEAPLRREALQQILAALGEIEDSDQNYVALG
ncbi:hypothetical protein NLG97_g6894 [Lecanicillium saksenae]|uniref:Uncharacterized protein n=1 Tax=Lecanicillium saksenae TaxID=468837 RepID=A0ACC1QQ70_9HYPO|nr:hypothetical protein NLG97_g6894 [Lecanicillium saksenae]